MKNTFSFFLLGLTVGIFGSLHTAGANTLGFSVSGTAANSKSLAVTVLDDETNFPLPDVEVSVSDTTGSQAIRSGKSNASGFITFTNISQAPQTFVFKKTGYVNMSVIGVTSSQITTHLQPLKSALPELMSSGTISGFQNLGGSTVHAGLVLKSLSALDLLSFDIAEFVSPLKDEIDVLGRKIQLPSNTVLPDQTLEFGMIHLNKPLYRLPLKKDKSVLLAGIQGTANVSDLQGGSGSLDILNKLTFIGMGKAQTFKPVSDVSLDIDATTPLSEKHQVTVTAPPFTADVLSCAVTDISHDRQQMIPTDVKLAISSKTPTQIKMVKLSGPASDPLQTSDVITVATSDNGRRVSGIFTENAQGVVNPGTFADVALLIDNEPLPPSLSAQSQSSGVASTVLSSQNGQPLEYYFVLPAGGLATMNLSKTVQGIAVASYALLQMDFGKTFDEKNVDGSKIMTQLEKFTRTSASVK